MKWGGLPVELPPMEPVTRFQGVALCALLEHVSYYIVGGYDPIAN